MASNLDDAGDSSDNSCSEVGQDLLEDWDIEDWNPPDGVVEGRGNLQGSGDTNQTSSSEYVDLLGRYTGLHIIHEAKAKRAFEAKHKRELELFYLFFKKDFFETLRSWLNEKLKEKKSSKHQYASVGKDEFNAYLGLEMGMSLVQFNSIRQYWGEGAFLGHPTFTETMGRNRFMTIRSFFQN